MGRRGSTNFSVPICFFIHALKLLGFIHNLVSSILFFIGLQSPPSTYQTRSLPLVKHRSSFTNLHHELLSVFRFSELVETPECCVVCMYEFDPGHEVCQLSSCKHVFDRCCIDRWIDYGWTTCPLCRTPFIPERSEETYDELFWAGDATADYSFVFGI